MSYWVAQGGQKQGPYPVADLRRMIAEGKVAMSDLAWTEGMASWAPLSQVLPAEAPQVAPSAPAPAPAPAYQPPAQQYTPPQQQYAPPQQQQYVTPQQQQYVPPQQQYAPPAQGYVQPGYAAPAASMATPGAGPIPPDMHWAVVLILACITCGIFGIVWIFKEAGFVKRIDPSNGSKGLFIFVFAFEVVYLFITVGASIASRGNYGAIQMVIGLIGLLVWPVMAICAIVAIFKMRRSMMNYYNSVENIGLRLSGVMTFFFNIYYFQHHFSRIAEWKRTGRLTPQ